MNVVIQFFKDLYNFVYSKIFLIQIVLAIAMLVIISYIALEWLDKTTNHDQSIIVPSLSKKSLAEVEKSLEERDLRFEVQDSASFNPDYPRFSVVEQSPTAGSEVKENRKIYVTLNPSGYRKIEVPNIIQKTIRQAKPKLVALGFRIGSLTYRPNIAKDMVLELRYKGKKLKPGTKLMKTAIIDLVLGDGGESTINLSE